MVEGLCLCKLTADNDGAVLGQIQRVIGCHQVVERLFGSGTVTCARAAEVDHIRIFHLRLSIRLGRRADILTEGDRIKIRFNGSGAFNDCLDILHIQGLPAVCEVDCVDILVKHHRDVRNIHAVFPERAGLVERNRTKALTVHRDLRIHDGIRRVGEGALQQHFMR